MCHGCTILSFARFYKGVARELYYKTFAWCAVRAEYQGIAGIYKGFTGFHAPAGVLLPGGKACGQVQGNIPFRLMYALAEVPKRGSPTQHPQPTKTGPRKSGPPEDGLNLKVGPAPPTVVVFAAQA